MRTVVLASHQPLVRSGLRQALSSWNGVVVDGEASSGPAVVELLSTRLVDALLLDLDMPHCDGLALVSQILAVRPKLTILALSNVSGDQHALSVLHRGAAGFLTKDCAVEEVTDALSKVLSGRKYIDASIAEHLVDRACDHRRSAKHMALSSREHQVLCLMAQGKRGREIAVRLGLSPKTITTYKARILDKLDLNSDLELARYVIDNGLCP